MKLVHVGAAALNTTPLAFARNRDNVLGAIADAKARGVSILCLPELCLTGYGCEDAFLAPFVHERALESLHVIAEAARGIVLSVGLPIEHQGAVWNASCLIDDGTILGFAAKQSLAGDGIHYEPRWFKPWPTGVRTRFHIGRDTYPLGDLRFDCGGIRIGFEICEDAWVARRSGGALAEDAIDVILNPSASHFAFGKRDVRRRLVQEGSRAFGVTYVYANLLGNEAGRALYDGHTLVASGGAILAEGPRMRFADRVLADAIVDVDITRTQRSGSASFRPNVALEAAGFVRSEHAFPPVEPTAGHSTTVPWEVSPYLKEEELARAVALGLFDYVRKAGAKGFVVSLSGGADSAACSALVALSLRFALDELGADGLAARLAHVPDLPVSDAKALVGRMLTTAYQSTRNSGPITRNAARAVAEALGATHHELDVDALVEGYVGLASAALGRTLAFPGDDIALQNVQARVRAPSVWLLANVEGKLLLSTSNRSEAAVGYATMDGDTAGGLSPIAGIDKSFLRHFLRWLETEGPDAVGPIPELRAVNAQQPTAELRPPEAGQTDEGDLMPYDLLDAIERLAVRDRRSPTEVFRALRATRGDVPARDLVVHVERFFRLFARNQWKRERYAPSFHVDDESLDPKTFYRFPILSGGFAEELAELRALVP